MRVFFTPRAVSDAGACGWRDVAALEAALERLSDHPAQGALYESEYFGAPIRRVLAPNLRAHIYYLCDGDNLTILTVWPLNAAVSLHE